MSIYQLIHGTSPEAFALLEPNTVQSIFTSSPYWAQRDYDPGRDPHPLGLPPFGEEDTPEEFVERLADTLDLLHPDNGGPLRYDGCLFTNIGDTRAGSGGPGGDHHPMGFRAGQSGYTGSEARARAARGARPGTERDATEARARAARGPQPSPNDPNFFTPPGETDEQRKRRRSIASTAGEHPGASPGYAESARGRKRGQAPTGPGARLGHDRLDGGITGRSGHGASAGALHKPKDLIGIPFMLAQAMKARGWYWRADIIWHKPNPKPEGPGDRPIASHEYVWLFTPSPKTYWDHYPVQEPARGRTVHELVGPTTHGDGTIQARVTNRVGVQRTKTMVVDPKRLLRDVWKIGVSTFKGAHFATFPPELAEVGILASTPEVGCCPECRMPATRVTQRDGYKQLQSIGWEPPACGHGGELIPSIVLDPFNGAGSTGIAAMRNGRDYVGIEDVEANIALTRQRFARALGVMAHGTTLTFDPQVPPCRTDHDPEWTDG